MKPTATTKKTVKIDIFKNGASKSRWDQEKFQVPHRKVKREKEKTNKQRKQIENT